MSRLLRSEGAGNAGRPMRPKPRVRNKTKHTSVVTTVTPEITRHSPRNGFNGFLRALPGDQACLTPSSALLIADLTPASGRQNHTTSPSASARFVKRTARVHRIPFPTLMTLRNAPLWVGTGRISELIWLCWQAKFLEIRNQPEIHGAASLDHQNRNP